MKSHATLTTMVTMGATLALVILCAWVFVAYKSFSFKREALSISVQTKDRSAEDAYLISVKSALRESKEEVGVINARFITQDDIPDFIGLLEEEARIADIKADVGSILVEPSESELLDGVLRLQMNGSGTWSSAVRFIAKLDSLPYALRIENIRMTSAEVEEVKESSGKWNLVLDLRQYLGEKI